MIESAGFGNDLSNKSEEMMEFLAYVKKMSEMISDNNIEELSQEKGIWHAGELKYFDQSMQN
jgi:hypothetical protein